MRKNDIEIDKDLTGANIQDILYLTTSNKTKFAEHVGYSRTTVYTNCFHQLKPSVFYINKLLSYLEKEKGLSKSDIQDIINKVKNGNYSSRTRRAL